MTRPAFVDCHSHVCPSGDDGAQSLEEAVVLCRDAARSGTGLLFATPHVWPHLGLSSEREAAVRETFVRLRRYVELELRLGFELTPHARLLDEDPHRYALEGTDRILIEVPFVGGWETLLAVAGHAEAAGLTPVIAHPERAEEVLTRPELADELAERGWLLQVNGSSLLGRHGLGSQELGWALLEHGTASLVASDGHRQARPVTLDAAYDVAFKRFGVDANGFFDGSALGVAAARAAA